MFRQILYLFSNIAHFIFWFRMIEIKKLNIRVKLKLHILNIAYLLYLVKRIIVFSSFLQNVIICRAGEYIFMKMFYFGVYFRKIMGKTVYKSTLPNCLNSHV